MIMMFQVGMNKRISAAQHIAASIAAPLRFLSRQTLRFAASAQPSLLCRVPSSTSINFVLAKPITKYVLGEARPY